MVGMRHIAVFMGFLLLIPGVQAAIEVNSNHSDSTFFYDTTMFTSGTQYFLIEGSEGMTITIEVTENTVVGSEDYNQGVSVYLVNGVAEEDGSEPEDYDAEHSNPFPSKNFHTTYIMTDITVQTLVVMPFNGSSANFHIRISGNNPTANITFAIEVCLIFFAVPLAIFLVYLKMKGVIGRPRPVRRKMKVEKEEEDGDDLPYRLK